MKKHLIKLLCLALAAVIFMPTGFIIPTRAVENQELSMSNPKVCNLTNPLGVDVNPLFSWINKGAPRGSAQSAYRIVVSKNADLSAPVWDSGKVSGAATIDVPYAGSALVSKTKYYWTVESFVGEKSVKSPVQYFVTGILNQNEWKGDWISRDKLNTSVTLSGASWIWRKVSGGVPKGTEYFRKTFTVDGAKTLKSVFVAYTADDEATLYINGVECSSMTLWSSGRLFDATDYILPGQNVVAIRATNNDTTYAGLLAKIVIEYADTTQNIVTDTSWKVSTALSDGWNTPTFNDAAWLAPDQATTFGSAPWGTGVALESANNRNEIMLRREFNLTKTVKEAYAYICGLGFFELTINGTLPDDTVLNPYTTQYSERVLYRTFDVTSLLKSGNNAIGVELGNSFYNEVGGVWNWSTAPWRDDPKLLFNLEIKYTDGSSETIVSDTSWKYTDDGPIVANSMYYGDYYDARKEKSGWNTVGYDASAWNAAKKTLAPTRVNSTEKTPAILSSHMKGAVRRVATIAPESIKKLADGAYLITASEILAGWLRLTGINESAGHKITITYGQRLNPDGTLALYGGGEGNGLFGGWYPAGYHQQDTYISAGRANESYEPKFSYKGHLYILIEGFSGNLTADNMTIYRVSNATETLASFESNNELFNRLHEMMVRAMANNFLGDHCDPMLEKTGWTGDATVSLGSLMYNYDMLSSLPEWLRALDDVYNQYGTYPIMTPAADWGIYNQIIWNGLFIFGAEALVDYFGANSYAEQTYAALKKYTDRQIGEIKNNGWLFPAGSLGDWVAPIGGTNAGAQYNENTSEGNVVTGTAYMYGILQYMETLATKLGKSTDATEFKNTASKVKTAFNNNFYDSEKKIYQSKEWNQIGTRGRYRQTDNLVAVAFGLVAKTNLSGVMENLVKDIKDKGYHLDTGCVGTYLILPVLSDNGYADVAYKIAVQTTYPSWGFWVENGASSTWEMWETTTRSFDHYFLGTYDEWYYSHLVGINNIKNGYQSFTVTPGLIGDLSYVNSTIKTVRGTLTVNWKLTEGGGLTLDLVVPFGSTATVTLPTSSASNIKLDGATLSNGNGIASIASKDGYTTFTAGGGSYSFTSKRETVPVYKDTLADYIAKLEAVDTARFPSDKIAAISAKLTEAKSLIAASGADQLKVNEASDALRVLLIYTKGSEVRKTLVEYIESVKHAYGEAAEYGAAAAHAYNSALLTAALLADNFGADDAKLEKARALLETAVAALSATKSSNLALNKPATASSTNNDTGNGWGLGLINDGITVHVKSNLLTEYTGYCSNLTANVDHTEWVRIDLQTKQPLNTVVIYPSASLVDGKYMGYGFPSAFKIQVSDNGSSWTTVYEAADYPLPEFGPLAFSFASVEARYVRFFADHLRPKVTDNNSYRLQLAEFEIYNLADRTPIKDLLGFEVSDGVIDPVFENSRKSYTLSVPNSTKEIMITPYTPTGVSVSVNGVAVTSGTRSAAIALIVGNNSIKITPTDGAQYTLIVTRADATVDPPIGGENTSDTTASTTPAPLPDTTTATDGTSATTTSPTTDNSSGGGCKKKKNAQAATVGNSLIAFSPLLIMFGGLITLRQVRKRKNAVESDKDAE